MPTFNRAQYIKQSLESIQEQTRPASEIIVVDDGSTDGTRDIVETFPDARYIWQENGGVAAARNRALAAASGDVIAWLDSDDLWEPTFLEEVVALLEDQRQIQGVYTGLRHINCQGQLLNDESGWVTEPRRLFCELLRANRIATPAIVLLRSCYDEVGTFDEELRICEDADMWLRMAAQFAIVGLARKLVRVRIHEANTMDQADAFACYQLLLVEKWRQRLGPSGYAYARGYALRQISFRYFASGNQEQGWDYFARAFCAYPEILTDLDTLYELAIGTRSRGHRGQPTPLDGTRIIYTLAQLMAQNEVSYRHRRVGLGNLNLALAMLNDQAGDWRSARRYLLDAIRYDPKLISRTTLRRLAKICMGKRLMRFAKGVLTPLH
jgi:glycosyltransferase involved in cell wall biosynthesis